jgi:hypothetical protein
MVYTLAFQPTPTCRGMDAVWVTNLAIVSWSPHALHVTLGSTPEARHDRTNNRDSWKGWSVTGSTCGKTER